MRINADFDRPAAVRPEGSRWLPSPLAGVERLMLDRVGDEVARATSQVRYAPGSSFDGHSHDLGEEFLVLEGVFSDESGDFPAGCYVRNPPGTAHAPHSREGCTIFVKLRQFQPGDDAPVRIDTTTADWTERVAPGVSALPLHRFGTERVALYRFEHAATVPIEREHCGLELLVLAGEVRDGGAKYGRHSWLRYPPGRQVSLHAVPGTEVYLKTGHLEPLPSGD
jgi:anti-sigma factor ChrR (cupin superfamily)